MADEKTALRNRTPLYVITLPILCLQHPVEVLQVLRQHRLERFLHLPQLLPQ